MKNLITKVIKDERGQTLSEYGLLIALIAVACIGAAIFLGKALSGKFQGVADEIEGAQSWH